MKKQNGNALIGAVVAILMMAGAIGWVWNIVKLFQALAYDISAMFVARCVGVFFAPLGAILGYL